MKTLTPLLLTTILLAACTGTSAPATSSGTTVNDGLSTSYTNSTDSYSLEYPSDWSVKENQSLPTLNRVSTGTAFVPPSGFGSGTVLLESMLFVEKTNGACSTVADAEQVTINGQKYIKGRTSDAGAGNLYLETMYASDQGNACYTFTVYQHRCNIGPDCAEGQQQPFDDTSLLSTSESIIGTFHTGS